MGKTSEEVVGPEISEAARASVTSKNASPLDKSVAPQARQMTIENKYKKEQRELAVAKIGRCLFVDGLPFNLVNSSYWIEMVEELSLIHI